MTEQPTIAGSRPAVVAALSPFGNRITTALTRRLERRHGRLPASWRLVDATSHPAGCLAPRLTEVLNVRNAPDGLTVPHYGRRRRAPWVLAIAAACELDDLAAIERFARAAHREFRRSCLAGTLGLLVYAGSIDNRVPSDALLAAIEADELLNIKLVYTDTDARGSRIGADDAELAGTLFLTYLLESEALQERVASLAAGPAARNRLLTFGVGRVDLSEATLRNTLRRRLRDRARAILFPPDGVPSCWSAAPGSIDLPTLTTLQRSANGSLRPVETAIEHTAGRLAEHWLGALLRETGETTREALLALIPPPLVPRPGFWRRLWTWLCRCWRRLGRFLGFWRQTHGEAVSAPDDNRPGSSLPRSSTAWRSELTAADRQRLQLGHLALALQADPDADRAATPEGPFERVLGDLPGVRDQNLAQCVPSDSELIWSLSRALPTTELLGAGSSPEALRDRMDSVCDRLLKLDQRDRLLKLQDYRGVLDRMAETVAPLFCGAGARAGRRILLPARLLHAYEVNGHEKAAGADEEVVFLTVQAGITLRSINLTPAGT
jgi:hypothetical protein